MAALAATVRAVVDRCGFQVMVDVADQYREPLRSALDQMAEAALGSLAGLPSGLRCADLRAMGYSAKDAVDYWFLTLRPDLMDADLNGIPCETVFADVAAYMPAYY